MAEEPKKAKQIKLKFNQDYRFAIDHEVQSVKKGDVVTVDEKFKGIADKGIASIVGG